MKKHYFLLSLSFVLLSITGRAQTTNLLYEHTTFDLNELHNMPFDETRLLVVSGFSFSPNGIQYNELDLASNQLVNMTFAGVDTILSTPESKDDKLFFEASISGMGRELVMYDGTSPQFYEFNIGAGSSNPEIISFEDEIYVIANDGNVRQLYKYAGGTSFNQISEETVDDVVDFIANRGDEYYYITFSGMNGRSIESTEDNNGVLTHTYIAPGSYQESLGDVVLLGGDIFMLSYFHTLIDASYRVDKIGVGNTITTHHFQSGGQYSSGHLLTYDNDILFYLTDPGNAEILNVSVAQQAFVQVSIDPGVYNIIGNHVVQNNKLFIYGHGYVLDVSSATPVPVLEDGSLVQIVPAFESGDAFYLYEVASFGSSGPSGIIEVSSLTNQAVRYLVSNDGGFFSYTRPVVANNGDIKFIFKTEDNVPSTDIYSLSSVLTINEGILANFELYPNPSVNDHFTISLPQAGEVKLLTIDGQIVRSMNLSAGENSVEIDELSSGVYLVEYNHSVQRVLVE